LIGIFASGSEIIDRTKILHQPGHKLCPFPHLIPPWFDFSLSFQLIQMIEVLLVVGAFAAAGAL
jgi:hypothetical protein